MTMAAYQEEFNAGDLVTFSASFQDADDGTAVDPGKITFAYYVDPNAPVYYYFGTTDDIVRDGVGLYHIDLDTTGFIPAGQKGLLIGQFSGTKPAQSSSSITVTIVAPAIPLEFSLTSI